MKSLFVMLPLLAISFQFMNPCSPKSRFISNAPTSEDVVYDVEVIYPEFRPVAQVYDVEGVFDASESFVITANANGQVEQVFLSVGDRVAEKDPVVAISNSEILDRTELMRLKVKEFSARLKQTENGFEEINTEDRPVTHDEVAFLDDDDIVGEEAKKKNFGMAEQKTPGTLKELAEILEARIAFYNKEISVLEKQLLNLNQTSSANGIVTEIFVTEGNKVKEQDRLVAIAKMDPMSVSFALPQTVASFVDKHSEVSVSPLEAETEILGQGIVYYISPNIDAKNETITVKAHVDNPELRLRGGQKAGVHIQTRKTDTILVLPQHALTVEGEDHFIFIAQGHQAKRVLVEVGKELENDFVEVKADVRVDDPVIVNRPLELEDESFVRVQSKGE